MIATPNWKGLVPWVAPEWFEDGNETRFYWTSVIMHDADLVISKKPIAYTGPTSLIGMRLGGILGHRYVEIEPLIATRQIIREDTVSQVSNFKRLDANRIDFTFCPKSSWEYWKAEQSETVKKLTPASKVRSLYDRRLLVSRSDPDLAEFLKQAAILLARDTEWQRTIQPYSYRE